MERQETNKNGRGQSGTHLRQARASTGPRVSIAKTEMNRNENEYFGQITMAFLSSRIQIFIFVSFSSLYALATLTRGPDDALVSLR